MNRVSSAPGLRAKIWGARLGRGTWKLSRFILLLGIQFVLIYPILYMVITAFRGRADMEDPSVVWLTRTWTLDNMALLVKTMNYPALLGYTAEISFVSAFLQTFVCGVVGYGFARFDFPFKRILFAVVILTIIVPVQTYLSPLYMMFRFFWLPGLSTILDAIAAGSGTFKLVDSPWPFWLQSLFGMGFRSGLFIFIFRQFYRGMPGELEEAALIDGCGAVRTYFRVMLPNARSSMITVFIFSTVWHWNDYFVPAVFSETRQTVATALASLRSTLERLATQNGSDQLMVQVQVQAGALLAIAPMLVLFIVAQRYFTEGIERSGIVG